MHFKHLVCAHLVIAAAALAACQGPDADQVRQTEQASAGVVDEGDGCTLTQGYWKNHEESWPVSSLTIGGVDYSAEELLDLLRTPTKGDASLILGHQLIAALLNVASGAGTPQDVADALAAADAWMAANQDADGRLPYKVKGGPAAGDATALGDTLAQFNEGSIGPGHCDDGPGTSSSSSSGSTSASSATSSATSSGAGGAGGSGGGTTSSSSTTSGAGGAGGGTTCTKPCTPSVILGQCSSDEMCIEGCCVPVPAIDFN